MVCVHRAINSVCFDSGDGGFSVLAAEGEGRGVGGEPGCSEGLREGVKYSNKEGRRGREMVECRICQEEGLESDMESPCACCGTLKFAHRKCIQKWCYKKGDITCEICNQVYAPNYSAPPPQTNSDVLAVDIRQTWGARIDLHDSHFLAIAAAEQGLLHVEYEDYTAAHNSGIACCRIVAFILILILYFRQLLMVTSGPLMARDVPAYFNVSLQFAGFLLPCYVIARSCYLLQRQHRRQSWP